MSEKENCSSWIRNYIFVIGGALLGGIALLMGHEEMAGTILTAGILLHIFI